MSRSQPRATAFQLVFITYVVICGGAYGLEEMVSASGPGLTLITLLVLPFLYGAPLALVCAELTSRVPVQGGYYQWVRLAFGNFMGYNAAWLAWLAMFATNASFAVLFGSYLRYFVPDLPASAQVLASVAVVWLAIGLNARGIRIVGTASVIFTLLIAIPFAAMTLIGLSHWRYNPVRPFVSPDVPFATALVGSLVFGMWLYGGFEKVTVTAEEVEDPVRAFPRALALAVPLCAASYILPTLAALAANGDWRQWTASYFMVAAARLGGPLLGAAMAAGALVSNLGLLTATTLSQSRLPMVLADDGLFPRVLQGRHPRFGTPVLSLIVTGVVVTLLCGISFAKLVGAAALVQSLAYLLIYAAYFRLRARRDLPVRPGGFHVPLGTAALMLMVLPSVVLVALVVRHGLWPDGRLDVDQVLLDLAIVASGPLTYIFARRGASSRTETLIITAASAPFAASLLALLGSLRVNWPGHPPVLVYDIGLDADTRARLAQAGIAVREVPAFCPHWRDHFTWKIWCLHDAPATSIIWMDAGLVVLRPMDEMLDAIRRDGYFVTTNGERLDWEASAEACIGCGLDPDFRLGRATLAATFMGFRKQGVIARLLDEALSVALVEQHIAATDVRHRHDQAILSLLLYKHLDQPIVADPAIYLPSLLPTQAPGQKIWVHRRRLLPSDAEHFARYLDHDGPPHVPTPPYSLARAQALAHLYRVYWCFGAGERDAAAAHLRSALSVDATLVTETRLLSERLMRYRARLQAFSRDRLGDDEFGEWAEREYRLATDSAQATGGAPVA